MIAALAALAVAGHYGSPFLLPKADLSALPEPGCDLQQRACAAQMPGGGRVELSITPRPIPFLQPLRLEVTTSGIGAKRVAVDFAGESMNMGFNRSELAPAGSGRHGGEASLPVCVTGQMAWIATVLIETDRQRIAVPYRFTVGR
jgi:hypothetical protein